MSQTYIPCTAGLGLFIYYFREKGMYLIRVRRAVLSLGLENAAICSWHFNTRKM